MSLSSSRVTSVWAYTLADLQPVPQEKLAVLLKVCTGETAGKDAGSILQRVVPLTMFLEKAHDKVRAAPTAHVLCCQARQLLSAYQQHRGLKPCSRSPPAPAVVCNVDTETCNPQQQPPTAHPDGRIGCQWTAQHAPSTNPFTFATPCQNMLLQNVHQVVPAVVQLLQQLPSVWLAPQTGPKQVQADYTQVMMDLRK